MNYKILVVEDDQKVQNNIKEILENENYEVTCKNSGNEALKELENSFPDLIISDVMMPGLSGFELLEEIKKNPSFFTIPFIFLTARADISDIRKGMNIGSDDYLVKPFRAKDLLNSVKIRMEKKQIYDDKIALVSENLSSHVPHELRTPLVTIIGYPDILLDYYNDFSDEEKKDMINSIKTSGLRLQETVEKFILLSEIQKLVLLEKEDNNKTIVDNIEGIILELGGIISAKYNRPQSFKADIEDVKLNMSDKLFTELLRQLIENAYKYSDSPSEVQVNAFKIEEGFLIEVKDQGVGLNKDEMKVLDTFIQYERDRRVLSGLGLGLSIVKQILNHYNASLKIESQKGTGSNFSFLFKNEYTV